MSAELTFGNKRNNYPLGYGSLPLPCIVTHYFTVLKCNWKLFFILCDSKFCGSNFWAFFHNPLYYTYKYHKYNLVAAIYFKRLLFRNKTMKREIKKSVQERNWTNLTKKSILKFCTRARRNCDRATLITGLLCFTSLHVISFVNCILFN